MFLPTLYQLCRVDRYLPALLLVHLEHIFRSYGFLHIAAIFCLLLCHLAITIFNFCDKIAQSQCRFI